MRSDETYSVKITPEERPAFLYFLKAFHKAWDSLGSFGDHHLEIEASDEEAEEYETRMRRAENALSQEEQQECVLAASEFEARLLSQQRWYKAMLPDFAKFVGAQWKANGCIIDPVKLAEILRSANAVALAGIVDNFPGGPVMATEHHCSM